MATAALSAQTATLHRDPTGPRFPSASRTDGVTVFYYDSLHEAVAAAVSAEASVDSPDEITLLADLVLDEPLIVDDGKHIRLVAGGSDRTIRRSTDLIEYPVIWVKGDSASLSLGKIGMEFELVIDGGYLNSPPIEAHAPLVAVSGPDSKLIMYDKVTLQNNINNGGVLSITGNFQNGAGVFIFTLGYIIDRPAEFIMKGGTIRGNINNTQNPIPCGGGVTLLGFGIFTMEGGVIMDNTAGQSGGGVYIGEMTSFKKTGGIIYGSNAPAGYRNTALVGLDILRGHGHSVAVATDVVQLLSLYREDTVGENDNLTFTGTVQGFGAVGKGEKWDTPKKAFLRMLAAIVLPLLSLIVCFFLIYWKITLRKLTKIAREAADMPGNVFENVKLSNREKEVGNLLLSELSVKQIATVMHIAYTTVDYHAKKLYRKMGVQGRTELIIKMRNEERRE